MFFVSGDKNVGLFAPICNVDISHCFPLIISFSLLSFPDENEPVWLFPKERFDMLSRDGARVGIWADDWDTERQFGAITDPTGVEVETRSCVSVSSTSDSWILWLFHSQCGFSWLTWSFLKQ